MKIALLGAGGKMGCRIADSLLRDGTNEIAAVEVSAAGRANLQERGLEAVSPEKAIPGAGAVILAVPDRLIRTIARDVVPLMDRGSMLVALDPAAPYAGALPERQDVSYFCTHPCHPPLFGAETRPEARADWFGGTARQHIVCALAQGPETDYAAGERLARIIYAPVIDSFRVTVEQMALLEPILVETFTATLISAMKEGLDTVVEMGVPREAAEAFLFGHLRIEFGIIFGFAGFPFSDGAQLAVEKAGPRIFRDDWKQIFTLESLRRSVAEIIGD